jgi:hypothetical protein
LKEIDQTLVVRWADRLIHEADYLGNVDTSCFYPSTKEISKELIYLRDYVLQENSDHTQNDNHDVELNKKIEVTLVYKSIIKGHLLTFGYIHPPAQMQKDWVLTERGKLVKELGGHKKYQKHRKREINVLKHQWWINLGLIIAATLSAIMPWIIEKTKSKEVQPIIIKADSVWMQEQIKSAVRNIKSNQGTGKQTLPQQTKQATP